MEREKRIRNLRKLDDCASTSLSLSLSLALALSRSFSLSLTRSFSLALALSRSSRGASPRVFVSLEASREPLMARVIGR